MRRSRWSNDAIRRHCTRALVAARRATSSASTSCGGGPRPRISSSTWLRSRPPIHWRIESRARSRASHSTGRCRVPELALNKRQYLELEKIALGAFAPLDGFMGEADFRAVVADMRLASGEVFSLPVVLDVAPAFADQLAPGRTLSLSYEGAAVGEVDVAGIYSCDKATVAAEVYGTADPAHAGVAHFLRMGACFVGGRVRLTRRVRFEFSSHELTPAETRARFAENGWRTVAGFQTRNVPHRAHEYLQRTALELVDGLFIQPLVGYKKRGDYQPAAILAGYEALLRACFPPSRVLIGVLSTSMR